MRKIWLVLLSLLLGAILPGCGYNTLQSSDEQIKAAWSEVLNQYQRRADPVPNLVNTVKGYAKQENDVLLGVTEARAGVGSIQATPELINDRALFAKFQAAQGQLSALEGGQGVAAQLASQFPTRGSSPNELANRPTLL